MKHRLALDLLPISSKISAKGGFSAHVVDRLVLDTDAVMREVVEAHRLPVSPKTLRMYTEMVLETMVANTLKDGYSRRLDDYFTLQVDVKGRFDEKGSDFDPSKHKIVLTLKPLNGLRRKPSRDLVPYTKNNGPKVVLTSLRSVSTPESEWLKWGDDLMLAGENLEMMEGDELKYVYADQEGYRISGSLEWDSPGVEFVSGGIRFEWKRLIGDFSNRFGEKEKSFRPTGVAFQLRSRGGVATANRQTHRIAALFDSWRDYIKDAFPQSYPPKPSDYIWKF